MKLIFLVSLIPLFAFAQTPAATPAVVATPTPPASSYQGHGTQSLAPEVIAKFVAPPLDRKMSKKVASYQDVLSTGLGMVSPDGKKLFFSWRVTGTNQLWRVDGPQRFPVQITGGEDATTLEDITPDGRYLIIQRDVAGQENPGLYLQPTKGGALIEIQRKEGVQSSYQFVSDDSKYIYFSANDITPDSYAIYRYNIEAQSRELLFSTPGIWGIADNKNNSRLLLEKYVGSNQVEVYEYTLASKELVPVIGVGEKKEHTARYGARDGEVLILTNKSTEFRRLFNLKGGQLSAVSPDVKMDVESFSIDRKKTRIILSYNNGGYTEQSPLDAKTFKKIPFPKFEGAEHVIAGVTTRDGRYTTLGIMRHNAPRTNYVYDWKTKKLVQWVSSSTPEIDTSNFAKSNLEYYVARDGTKIPMFVRRPSQCADKVCPVVVNFHGGPEGQSTPGFYPFAQLFVDEGFVFVEPNVRGSDGYGRTWLDSDNGAKRLAVITDIEDASRYIKENWKKGDVVPKIGVMGGSYGGYATLVAMSKFAGAYDAGVSIVGMSNLVTFLMNTAPYRRILRISEYGDPVADKDALVQLSPMTFVEQIKAPLLIVQGVSDPRVPAGEAVQIHEALQKRSIDSQLILFGDEGHGASKSSNRILQNGHTLNFFIKHLK